MAGLGICFGVSRDRSTLEVARSSNVPVVTVGNIVAPADAAGAPHTAASEIVMVDGYFIVDGPCVKHAEKAVIPCFVVDRAFGQMVDGAMFNFNFYIFWQSSWYNIEDFRTNFSILVYLA